MSDTHREYADGVRSGDVARGTLEMELDRAQMADYDPPFLASDEEVEDPDLLNPDDVNYFNL